MGFRALIKANCYVSVYYERVTIQKIVEMSSQREKGNNPRIDACQTELPTFNNVREVPDLTKDRLRADSTLWRSVHRFKIDLRKIIVRILGSSPHYFCPRIKSYGGRQARTEWEIYDKRYTLLMTSAKEKILLTAKIDLSVIKQGLP